MFAKKFRGQQKLLIKMPAAILNNPHVVYSDNRNCYMCRAIKEQFGLDKNDVYADPQYMAIKGQFYEILGNMGSSSFLRTWHPDNSEDRFEGEYLVIPLQLTEAKNACDRFMVQQTLP